MLLDITILPVFTNKFSNLIENAIYTCALTITVQELHFIDRVH
jgi:hypothetical protein